MSFRIHEEDVPLKDSGSEKDEEQIENDETYRDPFFEPEAYTDVCIFLFIFGIVLVVLLLVLLISLQQDRDLLNYLFPPIHKGFNGSEPSSFGLYSFLGNSLLVAIQFAIPPSNITHFTISGHWNGIGIINNCNYSMQTNSMFDSYQNNSNHRNEISLFLYNFNGTAFEIIPGGLNDEHNLVFNFSETKSSGNSSTNQTVSFYCVVFQVPSFQNTLQHKRRWVKHLSRNQKKLFSSTSSVEGIHVDFDFVTTQHEFIGLESSVNFLQNVLQTRNVFPDFDTCSKFCIDACELFVLSFYSLKLSHFQTGNTTNNDAVSGYYCSSGITTRQCGLFCNFSSTDHGCDSIKSGFSACSLPLHKAVCKSGTRDLPLICECERGWQDSSCDTTRDICLVPNEYPCSAYGSNCTQSNPGSFQCACTTGWVGDGINCSFNETCDVSKAAYPSEMGCSCMPNTSLDVQVGETNYTSHLVVNSDLTSCIYNINTSINSNLSQGECPCGFEYNDIIQECVDIDECQRIQLALTKAFLPRLNTSVGILGLQTLFSSFRCQNTIGSFLLGTQASSNVSNNNNSSNSENVYVISSINNTAQLVSRHSFNTPCHSILHSSNSTDQPGFDSSVWCCSLITQNISYVQNTFASLWQESRNNTVEFQNVYPIENSPGCVCNTGFLTSLNPYLGCSECLPFLDPTERCLCHEVTELKTPLLLSTTQTCNVTASLPLTTCRCDNNDRGGDGLGACLKSSSFPCAPNAHIDNTTFLCVCDTGYFPSYVGFYNTLVCCPCGFDVSNSTCIPLDRCVFNQCPCDQKFNSVTRLCEDLKPNLCNVFGFEGPDESINGVTCHYNSFSHQIYFSCDNSFETLYSSTSISGSGTVLTLWCCDTYDSFTDPTTPSFVGSCICRDLLLGPEKANDTGCSTCTRQNGPNPSGCECLLDNRVTLQSSEITSTCWSDILIVDQSCSCNQSDSQAPKGNGTAFGFPAWSCVPCNFADPLLTFNSTNAVCQCADGYTYVNEECTYNLGCLLTGIATCDAISTQCLEDSTGHFYCQCSDGFQASHPNFTFCTPPPIPTQPGRHRL
jgi:hypothetical protein